MVNAPNDRIYRSDGLRLLPIDEPPIARRLTQLPPFWIALALVYSIAVIFAGLWMRAPQ